MLALDRVEAIRISGQTVDLSDVLTQWHWKGKLLAELKAAGIQQILKCAAEEMELIPDISRLQMAANQFRRDNGLLTTGDTLDWLKRQQLSIHDFEAIVGQREVQRMLFDAVTANAESVFREGPEQWDVLELYLLEVSSENLAAEIRSQVVEDGATLSRAIESCNAGREGVRELRPTLFFRYQLNPGLTALLMNARIGELLGPQITKKGWQLIEFHSVQPAEFNLATKSHIQNQVFLEWLNRRIANSSISYPLLDLLTCQNDS